MIWKWKRPAAFLLAAAMIFTMPGVPASAVEAGVSAVHTGLCKHHPEHTEDCGYTEGTEGAACEHEHTEDCYTLVKKCIHEHDESCYPVLEGSVSENTATSSEVEEAQPTECTHKCSKESGCITKKLSCPHERGEHDDSYGYIPATEGTPCGYTCELCNSQDNGLVPGVSGNAPAECICETRCEQGAVNPDCPVCSAEDADLSACKGTEQATPLMAAAADDETISGNVIWENRNITTPVTVKGDTTITLKGENTITITDTAYTAALDMYSANLTIQGSGSLTVNVPSGKDGIADGSWSDTAGGTLTIKDGVKITTNGGLCGLSAKTIVIENGKLNLNSGWGINTASLTMKGGTLYATGKYGAISNSRYGNARNINKNLTILYSESQNAKTDDMSVGTAADTTREGDVKTIYIAKMGPRASLIVGAQQGTIQESLGSQTATFSVTGSKVQMNTLNVEWVGEHTGLAFQKSDNGATITVTADNTVKEGRYKLKLTADGVEGTNPNKATATATVTVAAAPKNPITIRTQPQVVYEKLDGESVAVVDVSASLASGQSGNITYQWYVNGTELQGTGSGSYNKIVLTKSNLTPVEGRDWEYSGQVYCKLSYNNYTVDTKTVTVTINTCTHAKYTHDGKCQQCGEPCRKEVLFIDEDGIPYSSELGNNQAMVGSRLISGGTFYFVRDIDAILRAGGGDGTNKKDLTLDLQGHKVKALDLQDCPYNSVTIKNGTIEGIGEVIATKGPTVLILDSVTIGQGLVNNLFTLTVKGDCVFERQVNFLGKTQLQGGTFQRGINVELGEPALALLADGYAFADADSDEILNVSNVDIPDRAVKVVAHTDQYHNGKCACGRICDHAGKVDSAGYCTRCHMLVEAFETGGKRYTSLENALTAAQDGDTITLRGPLDIENAEPIEISKNIILNLNGHTLSKSAGKGLLRILGSNVAIINGKVQNTHPSDPYHAVAVGKSKQTGAKLTLDNVTLEGSTDGRNRGVGLGILTGNEAVVTSGKFIGGIYTEGALTMSGGSADLLELGALKGIPVTLSGGSFDSIKIKNGADYQSLLAEGYAYRKKDGALLKLSEMKENTAVTVVKCSHPDDHSGGKVCPYCGYAAEVTKTDGSISYHRTTDEAIAAAGGGTVKLLANAGEITISSPLKLDLNGKTAAKLTVTGDVTLASLLPEGYVFKSGSIWITDLTGKELTNVSMAKIPIKSMDYLTKMSMTYGGAGTLLVKVAKETGTGAVSFQWYQVEDGKETAVGSATTKNQFDLSALKLPAGNHTFRFLATCDGYEKMSKDIVVTVQKADIRSGLIMPPTAQENLTYTGQEQALITAGSVTSGGIMQYSLTENGTYSQDIPAGTDAGTYTVWYRVIGDANHNDTAPASVEVSIGKKPLTISGVTAVSKPYDGTTDAGITSVTFDGMNLNRGTDYTVTASFDDASVGNGKNVTATVTLMGQTAKNYSLEQSSFTTTGSIIKAAAPDFTKETALVIVNGHEKTYTVTLPALPKLETPKEYGAPTYELGEIKLNDGYYTSDAKVENGELTLPIQKNDVKTTGSVGTVTVVIKSTNYEDITLTVNVNATNKLVSTVTAPTVNTLTYNGAEQALVTAGKTTGGTMLYRLGDSEWSEQLPTAKNAGEYTVWYKVQGNAEYADVAEQSLPVTVAKRAVTVTALDKSAYTGSTAPDLSSPEADKDYKVEGLVGADTLSGTVTLDYAQTPDMSKTGKTAINITGTLSNDNYAITYVSGTLTVSKQSSSDGGSSSGGANGSGNNDNTNQPEDKPQAPATGETKPIQPDKNGNAAVDNSSVQSAIDKAKQDAKKNGTTENGIGVTVPITPAAGQTSFNVTIKAQTLDLLVKENVRQLTVATDHLVSVTIGLDTLKQLDTASAGGDIILRADKVDALRSIEAKATIGTRPAYDLLLVYLSGGKEIPIANLNGHTISVRLPYTPAKGEQTGNLYAVYVDDAGKVEWITKSSYNASLKAVVFETGHFSVYGVGYKTFVPAFTDITGHWAADNILFAASRGLLSGTSDTTFSPDTGMTRGMFVTALGRLAGINPDSYQTGKFTDVKADAYYAPYVNWAAQTGIVEGVTATTFAPDTNINREQMAVIMKNYAAKLGYDLPQTLKAVTFADNTQISSWAKDAVKSMQQAGILAGKNENKFDPKGTATRAEVATVLRRFVEIVIDPQAANGWQQNDSGQWNYYRNGESVKGWLSEDQKWYWLDKVTGIMFAGDWKQIDGKWYYFYADGTMAVNTASDR
ncbi:S-layer homology domain-containing protein [uncultured Clostridium sp.]|uniref:S-layer homology domain-containing protein n=1 Tax=uncultured Clostridium sp. TaxID=59620 RepID=UPI0026DB7146|nr:S-layer homology domain-containing protein [uncultured Clostridium sp.]